ncbi:hypothetical protein SAMN06265337_4342 [Hymenobacter gelipurpurascens]|uniref:Uncharacterized protein n=2 Tax=Hymenobacter gelipurpurascens TaxID=89968 RepID=A0A212UHU4_9BACT|nr:hypothetical protein SAMN06265337_4342 [Hymenobacter gelipurpurascens]
MSANAQRTLGLTMGELSALYKKSPSMVDWQREKNDSGNTVIKFIDSRDNTMIMSLFKPIPGSNEELVTATIVLGPKEPFFDIFTATCRRLYTMRNVGEWVDTENNVLISVNSDGDVAAMSFTLLSK